MTYLALQNLWQQKLQLSLSVSGVGLAIMLIILLNGFLAGIYRQVTAYLDHMPADFVVTEEEVSNLLGARSLLPSGIESRARGVTGLAEVTPIISQFVILDIHDKKVVSYLVGYELGSGGGPWQLKAGRLPTEDDEVVVDSVMAQSHDITLGDNIEILDQDFSVVGLSDGTNSWMASFLFVDKRAAEQLLQNPSAISFLLLQLAPGADRDAVEARLHRRLRNAEVLPIATVKQNDINLLVRIFAGPLYLMVSIAFAVGTAILGMIVFTATSERLREFGVLKAVGAENRQLYWLVIQQGVAMALLGTLLGSGLAWLAAQLIMSLAPKFLIVVEPKAIFAIAFTGLLMGLLAAIAPVQRIAKLDPALVFRK